VKNDISGVKLDGSYDADQVGVTCEQILSFGISFYYCILENPGIWQFDIIPGNETAA
jgi:hypothetical protein